MYFTHLLRATFRILVAVSLLTGLSSCGNKSNEQSATQAPAKPAIPVPSFNGDSAYASVAKIVGFGPRIPNTKAHDACGAWIIEQVKQYADTVYVQQYKSRGFDGKILNGTNIIASFKPGKGNRILLTGHWDTRPWADQDSVGKDQPFDGANDGGSCSGILIEVARQLSIAKPDIGVDLVFFDLEDYGQPDDSKLPPVEDSYCLGSQYWAKNPHVPNYFARFGILLDMTGASNATFAMEGTSMQYAPEVVNYVWKIAADAGYSNYFVTDRTRPIIDDHYYVNQLAKIKMIDIVHFDPTTDSHFWKHWHTREDTLDKIDRTTLKAVGQTLMAVLYTELQAS